jgi:monofunctional biosynthetic peptidoglycan transglycosylase
MTTGQTLLFLRKWFFRALLVFCIGSFIWVLAYRWIDPPVTSVMIKRSLAYHAQKDSWIWTGPTWVDYQDISIHMKRAVVASEDQKFMDHWGVDWQAIQYAAVANSKGKKLRGGSTITQQVAKNVFLWEKRSWLRKGLELWFTLWIELLWSKERILEVYLNIAETGSWTFGVEDGAKKHFGVRAKKISPQQAAWIASALPRPVLFRSSRPTKFYAERQRWILRQMGGVQIPR